MTKMRVADYLVERLARLGLGHVFMVTGGGAMHLNDAFGRWPGFVKVCMHHEQACAMAAESYCRLSRVPAAVCVTTGPGGINALNGVYGAYTDSIAMIVVSGQVKRETMASSYPAIALRQLGDQEVAIVKMVEPITKYAVVLDRPEDAPTVVDRAYALATGGRPGPVWIDVPIDVQGASILADPAAPFDRASITAGIFGTTPAPGLSPNTLGEQGAMVGAELAETMKAIAGRLATAQRPIVLAGGGVRISGAHARFMRLVRALGVPVVTAWNSHDLVPDDDPCFVGRPGTLGDRAGNFAVQNSDFLLILGCRMNIRQVSYNWGSLAPDAWTAMIDVDPAELAKPTLALDLPVHADLALALDALLVACAGHRIPAAHRDYLAWCRHRRAIYPVVLPAYRPLHAEDAPINPYYFVERLFDHLGDDDIVVTADGSACVVTFQAANLKPGQRLYTNSGSASMGYDLPAAIGAHFAGGGRRVVCLAGDGSVMMNLQELQTIAGLALPIKIFVINNDGYHSIRQTQMAYFPDNETGVGPASGVTFPDFVTVGKAFGLEARSVSGTGALDAAIVETLAAPAAALCEVVVDVAQAFAPKLASRKLDDGTLVSPELDDMFPFLPRDELAGNRAWRS